MLLHIIVQRHGFLHHFFMNLRRVQHVQSVFMPHCDADMRCVETLFLCYYSDDVAVVYGRTQQFRILDVTLRYIHISVARQAAFHFCNRLHHFGVVLQHRIGVGVRAHEADRERLSGVERRIRRVYFANEAVLCVLFNPLREVMLTSRVVDVAINVANASQEVEIVGVRGAVVLHALVDGEHVLHVRSAVELSQIDHKILLAVVLERLCHVRNAAEAACYVQQQQLSLSVGGYVLRY